MEWLKLNNPAGHLDPGESPTQGCSRVALEETAYQFTPTALDGVKHIAVAHMQMPVVGAGQGNDPQPSMP